MGSMAWSYTQPVHAVTVGAFELTKTEVTVSQYAACVTAGACTAPATGNQCNWEVAGYEEHPVNCVDWDQSRAFCTWAGGRLATEAEWGHAARSGGQEIDYPWGNEMATCVYAVMYEGGSGCGTGRTMAVCSKPAGNSAQGVCDLAGNVREWVEDDWHGAYTGAPANGSAWIDNPRGSARVVRCGSLSSDDHHLRASFRYFDDPSVQHYGLGLRCAR
jgi:iron(II)-dependent oxidoreductase